MFVINRSVLARSAASIILAGAVLIGTSGCVFITKQATLIQYDPSDGIGASVGNVEVRNALGIAGEDGDAISLMITLINTGDRAAGASSGVAGHSSGHSVRRDGHPTA